MMATLNGYEMSIYYSNIVTKYIKGKYRGGEKGVTVQMLS